jgi:hypothetical protein
MFATPTAVLLGLHPVGMKAFILFRVVIPLLAFGASQGD